MSKKLTTKQFIENAKSVHGDKYDYSKASYKNNKTKVIIICSKHGEFTQVPYSHTQGTGCPVCGKINTAEHSRIYQKSVAHTTEDFIKQAKLIHGDKYDYSLVEYVSLTTKVKIICNNCFSQFEQSPANHKQTYGCVTCSNRSTIGLSLAQVLEKCKSTHGHRYDYSKSVYTNNYTPIEIVCREHGSFWQRPSLHYNRGTGCPKCSREVMQKRYHDRPTTLYYIKVTYKGITAYKIGITTKGIKIRYAQDLRDKDFQIEVLNEWKYPTGKPAYQMELEILTMYQAYKYKGALELLFDGNTELFDRDIMEVA